MKFVAWILSIVWLSSAIAEQQSAREPWWVRAKQPLHPTVEAALAEFTKKIVPLRRANLSSHMTARLDMLVEKTDLTDPEKKADLKKAADQAVDEAMKPFAQSVTETNRVRLVKEPQKKLSAAEVDQLVSFIDGWSVQSIALNRQVLGCTLPEDQPLWQAALETHLSAVQYAIWGEYVGTLRETKTKEIKLLLDPWETTYRKWASDLMKSEIEEMSQILDLDMEEIEQLSASSSATIERICLDERRRAEEVLTFLTDERRADYIKRNKIYNTTKLDTDPLSAQQWLSTLRKVLQPDEMAKFKQEREATRELLEKDWLKFLQPSFIQFQAISKKQMEQEVTDLLAVNSLPSERAKALDQEVKETIERAEAVWRETALQQIKNERVGAIRERIEEYKKSKRTYYFRFDESNLLNNDPVWKKSWVNIFTPEELQIYKSSHADRKARRELAVGMMMLAELDRHVAFTDSQRENLLPLAKQVVKEQTQLFPTERHQYWDCQVRLFFAAAKDVKQADLEKYLDKKQLENWRQAQEMTAAKLKFIPQEIQGATSLRYPEPEAVEHIVSDYLYQKTKAERAMVLKNMLLLVDDAGRVAELSDDVISRLETAARGASERVIEERKNQWAKDVRSHIGEIDVQQLPRRLDKLSFNNTNRRRILNDGALKQGVWKAAVQTEMTEAQQAAWKVETDARAAFSDEALAVFVMAEFDRRYSINSGQWEQLEPYVAEIVQDYRVDIRNYFSDSWYYRNYAVTIPVAGVPEAEAKAILSEKQWKLWKGDSAWHYWSGVKDNHDRRVAK